MKINRAQTSLIHVAKTQLGLDDEEYRTILNSVCGVDSSKAIRSHDDFKQLIKAFIKLGFNPEKAIRQTVSPRVSGASPAQLQHIRDLWLQVTNKPNDPNALNKFLQSRFRIDHLNMLPKQKAQAVIEALKEMFNRKYLAVAYEKIFSEPANMAILYPCFHGLINRMNDHEAKLILTAVACGDDRVFKMINQNVNVVSNAEVNHAGNKTDPERENGRASE